jgi:hypothetical protein
MLHRRSTATALVAVLLPVAAALTSCGFDYPTDRVNTIAAGVNDREGSVDVLGARLVAYADGQARLIGTLVYNDNDADKPAVLKSVEGAEGADATVTDLPDIEVPPAKHVNLAGDDTPLIAVTGDFTAGDVVPLTYSFSTSESVTLDVPVVKPCRQYADIASPDFAPEAADETDAPVATETPADEATAQADDTYLCDHPTPSAEEDGGH